MCLSICRGRAFRTQPSSRGYKFQRYPANLAMSSEWRCFGEELVFARRGARSIDVRHFLVLVSAIDPKKLRIATLINRHESVRRRHGGLRINQQHVVKTGTPVFEVAGRP
jgi:hypothetical protein